MKRSRLLSALAALSAVFCILSCEETPSGPVTPDDDDDKEQPGPIIDPEEYPYAEDTYFIMEDGEYPFKSVAAMMIGENIAIAATPDEGFTDVTSIMENSSEYFFAAVNPMLMVMGNVVDLMTEESLFTIISTLDKAPLETVAPGETSEISGGSFCMTYEDGVVTLKADILLTDNTWLGIHITANESADSPIDINSNIIGRGDEQKPLRTAFSTEQDGLLYMFLTPANISYFSELDIATWYLYMVVPTSMATGDNISTDALTSDDTFIFGMVDNLTPDNCFEITSSSLSDINGVFSIEKTETGYRSLWSFTVGEVWYFATFDGECRSVEEEAPVEESENFFSCGEEIELAITSAGLEKSEETWTLHLDIENGKTASITMPADFYATGGAFGFSQDPSMCVIYDGRRFSKAEGYSGTIHMLLDEEAGTVEAEFTNYDDCELYYKGKYLNR